MKMPFCLLSLVFFLLAAISVWGGETRTWTSADGRTVEAEFVRLDDDKVEIKTEKGLFRLDLGKLSPADQEFVRQQAAPAQPKRPAKMRIEDREWTLREGKVKARFVRARDANIQLRRGNQLITHSILFLTPEDAAYIQDLLESRGEFEKLKDDPTIKAVVAMAQSHKALQERKREQEAAALAIAAKSPAEEATAEIPSPRTDPEPSPAESPTPAVVAPVEATPVVAAPLENVIPTPMPAPTAMPVMIATPPAAQPLADSGLNSKDPWERDQAVMAASNTAAYYWLSGILGLLVIFGPIIYVFQRFR